MKSINLCIKNEKKILLISVLIGLTVTLSAAFVKSLSAYSDGLQTGISHNVLRLHVLADSDSEADQRLKYQVRDAVLELLEQKTGELGVVNPTLEQTREIINGALSDIETTGLNVIRDNNFNYGISAKIEQDVYFPTKCYGDITLPAGKYEALKIVLGTGRGNNWWCVMFPPLCFVDVTHSEFDAEATAALRHVLTDEEYNIVTSSKDKSAIPYKVKFKIVEWFQEMRNK